MKKQTAVEWLIEQVFNSDWKNMSGEDKLKLFEQAKQMEKEQIIEAAERWKGTNFADQYYNETYNK